jgi:DNA-binding transcriptional LysR family regulator
MEIFHAVMAAGSVIGAARVLNISQPAVSVWLRSLEDDLGLPLFDRIKGRLRPTREAWTLHGAISKVFDQVEVARATADGLRRRFRKQLRIVTVVALGTVLVPRAVMSFASQHPDVQIDLRLLPRGDVADLVARQLVDLGIAFRMPEPLESRTEEICRGRLVCIMPPGHPLAAHREVTAADVAAHPWISYVEGQTLLPIIDGAFAAAGIATDPSIRVLSISTVCSLVECGAGIGLVDEFSAQSAGRRLEYRVFSPLSHIGVDILHPAGQETSALVLEFIQHLRHVLGAGDQEGFTTD